VTGERFRLDALQDRQSRYIYQNGNVRVNGTGQRANSDQSLTKKSPSIERRLMADSKRTKKKPYQRVMKFPTAKGKIIAEVELSISPDYNVIEIVFQDKTSLTFNLESCFQVVPELVSWKSGSYKPVKRWRPVHSV
jgi:hypothetical protein